MTNDSEQYCVAYEYIHGGWMLGFEACLCPDIEKLHEMVEKETKEKGKLTKLLRIPKCST